MYLMNILVKIPTWLILLLICGIMFFLIISQRLGFVKKVISMIRREMILAKIRRRGNINYVFPILVAVVCLVCWVCVTYKTELCAVIQSIASDENHYSALRDTCTIVITLGTLCCTCYLLRQIKIMQDTSAMTISEDIYQDNTQKRNSVKIKDYAILMENIVKAAIENEAMKNDDIYDYIGAIYIGNRDLPDCGITCDKVIEFRGTVYHYEYLGQLLYHGKINFFLIFDTVTFPDDLWRSAIKDIDTNHPDISFLNGIRNSSKYGKTDNWNGIEYLYNSYELMRARDAYYNSFGTKDRAKKKEVFDGKIVAWKKCWDDMPY